MLKECIRSVLDQTRPADDVIVVSDGSTDDTAAVAASFGDRIRFVEKPNGGKSTCLNLALTITKSDFIWIMDDDDLADSKALEHLADALDRNPDAGFVFGTLKVFRQEGEKYIYFDPSYRPRLEEPDWKLAFLEEMFTFQPAMLVRKSAYDEVGLFNPNYIRSQDYEMTLRLVRFLKCVFIPEVIFYQRQHDGHRGSATERFAVAGTQETWLHYEKPLFRWVRQNYSLAELTPSFARSLLPREAERAALVQRLSISAKQALWDEVVLDLRQACALNAGPIRPEELRIAEALPRKKVAWQALADDIACQRQLRKIGQENELAWSLLVALVRPLGWQSKAMLKAGNFRNAFCWWLLILSLVGPRGFLVRLIKAF